MDHPLRPLCQGWLRKIKIANKLKMQQFGKDADEAMAFFNGPHSWLYDRSSSDQRTGLWVDKDSNIPAPSFRMSTNKAAEVVQLFGPALYHTNPNRLVNPRKVLEPPPIELYGDPNDPMLQQYYMQQAMEVSATRQIDELRSKHLEFYLNYTPNELGLKDHIRMAVDEALIKGMGVLWTETEYRPGSQLLTVGTFFDSVDNLTIDPDVESLEDAQWIARKKTMPVWEAEEHYGMPPGALEEYVRPTADYFNVQETSQSLSSQTGDTNHLIEMWCVYSKMGMGTKLKGVSKDLPKELAEMGENCYLVVSNKVPFPLNMNPWVMRNIQEDSQIRDLVQWPLPLWTEGWPFTPIVFHPVPKRVWPMSHLKPAMGELKFLNWAFSFMASKMRIASRDFIAVQKSASEELKKALLHGGDYELIELESVHGQSIDNVVQFLKHPEFNGDFYKVIEFVMHQFEQRTGLSELMYGMSRRAMRSASEAQAKQDAMSIRPDDMYSRVEEAVTSATRKEGIIARVYLRGEDVSPVMGNVAGQVWDQFIATDDVVTAASELEYRIEAGSSRKPNRSEKVNQLNTAISTIGPLLQNFATIGLPGPWNALVHDWGKAMELDTEKYMIPQPPPEQEQQPSEDDLKLQKKQDEHILDLYQDQEKHVQEMLQRHEEYKLKTDAMEDQNKLLYRRGKIQNQIADKQRRSE